MKILFTVDFYEPSVGGTQKVVKTLAEGLVKKGHKVFVATTKLAERKEQIINGVSVVEFEIKGNKISGLHGEVEKYKQYLISSKFDVILNYAAQQWTSDIMFDCLDDIKAKKIIVTCGFSALHAWYARRYFRQMPYWLSKYDQVIFTSSQYQDYTFCKERGVENLLVIPNGALESEFKSNPNTFQRKSFKIPKSHILLSLIGTHTGQKGHHEAIELLKKIDHKHTTLLIMGNEMGEGCFKDCVTERNSFNASLEAKKNDKQIVLADLPREKTVSALFDSDLFLFPSQIECAPLVIYESMAAGLPFVASKVGNIQEVVDSTKAGLLLPTSKQKNKSSIEIKKSAVMVNALLLKRKNLKEIGEKGRKAWEKNYRFEKIVDRYEDTFKSIIRQNKVRKTKNLRVLQTKNGVDVIIPTFNTGNYLSDAIFSVLNQSKKINKLIVVDDGSTDNTREIVKQLQKKYQQIKYIYQKNKGLSQARNTGIKASESEYVGLLDADDRWKKDKIKLQLEKFNRSKFKNLGVVYCEYDDIDQNGNKLKTQGGFRLNKKVKGQVLKFLLEHNYAISSGSGVLVKRSCFEKAGLFDEQLKACEDWDMWIRIAEAGFEFDFVGKKLVDLRRRPDSMQGNIKHMLLNSIRFFNKYTIKGYQIPSYHRDYLRNNIFSLMFQGPKNLGYLYFLRNNMNNNVASLIWPSKKDSFKAIGWVFYAKANQIWAKLKKAYGQN